MVLHKFIESMKTKRPEKVEKGWILHMDNASPHTANITRTFLDLQDIPILPQPPYSPDLSPADFWIFYRTKKKMKGTRFQSIQSIQEETSQVLMSIPQEEFRKCFRESWIRRWKRCILAGGDYFERSFSKVDSEPSFRPISHSINESVAIDHPYSIPDTAKSALDIVQLDHDYAKIT